MGSSNLWLGWFLLGNFNSFEIVKNSGIIASLNWSLLSSRLSLVGVAAMVVFINGGGLWQLEMVSVESVWANHVLGEHVHEWLLLAHLFVHELGDSFERGVLGVVVERSECL